MEELNAKRRESCYPDLGKRVYVAECRHPSSCPAAGYRKPMEQVINKHSLWDLRVLRVSLPIIETSLAVNIGSSMNLAKSRFDSIEQAFLA